MTEGDDKKQGKSRHIADPVAARHEESVLFTVGTLGAMRGAAPPAPAPAAPPEAAPGDDESGFINLNNLAGAAGYAKRDSAAAKPATVQAPTASDGESGFINLSHLSSFGGGDEEAPVYGAIPQLDIPMGIPMGGDSDADTRGVKIAIGVASVFLIVALGFLAYVVATRDTPSQTKERPSNIVVIPDPAIPDPVVPDPNIPDPVIPSEPDTGGLIAVSPPRPIHPDEDAGVTAEPDAAPTPAAAADAGAAVGEADADKTPPTPELAQADGGADLPLGLNRTQVKTVISAHRAQVDTCGGQRRSGTVIVRFTILPDGDVGGARVINEKKGSPEADCVAGIVKDMKFPHFSGASITINYPFVLPER